MALVWKLSPRCALLALVALLSASGHGADKEVEALLANMRNAYQQIKTATYTTEYHFAKQVSLTSFTFESPNLIRAMVQTSRTSDPNAGTMVLSDGDTIYIRQPFSRVYIRDRFSLDGFERAIPVNLESLCFFDWDRQLSTTPGKNMAASTFTIQKNQPWNGKQWTVLTRKRLDAQGVVCNYYIDPKTFLMWRTIRKSFGFPAPPSFCESRE